MTPSGLTSLPAGLETPEGIELRKKKIDEETGFVDVLFCFSSKNFMQNNLK